MYQKEKANKIWNLMKTYKGMDKNSILKSITEHLEFTLCKNKHTTNVFDLYQSLAFSIRDRLIELWNDTEYTYQEKNCKQVYYLSLEYLIGRSLQNNITNLKLNEVLKNLLSDIGLTFEELEEQEHDAGLGNGGLGRLAACFLDSMATLELPAHGYGIRYEYGIFEQKIEHEEQIECPDNWLKDGHPWEIERKEIQFPIQFYGNVVDTTDANGTTRHRWENTTEVIAMAYDVPISGYQTNTVNNLRLWKAIASNSFDFQLFNSGDFMKAVEEKQYSETISKVLYPNDKGFSGKELRLKQQYFFVSASLQDIFASFKKNNKSLHDFPNKIAIQLNDTHPSIAIPELIRLLMDVEYLEWGEAWNITQKVFSYTNHTVLPEALESWSVDLLGNLLPRHLQIIYQINQHFLDQLVKKYPNDMDRLRNLSIIEEGEPKRIRMSFLAIIGSHTVNGVSALHTELLKTTIFKHFFEMFPKKFQNKTNGITPRRWLKNANPELSKLITREIGSEWTKDLSKLKKLEPFATNESFQKEWRNIKLKKKEQFAQVVYEKTGIKLNLNSIFDVQVKRIHEYKRQLLNILYVITLYNRIRNQPNQRRTPRTIIIGGKAAPGYYMAKLIIHLINDVAKCINRDPVVGDQLKLIFLENYNVSLAQKIIPATELSEQISTAGMEASGTGNMKFALNGALTIGTLDGANVEMLEEVGKDNIFIFGLTAKQVQEKKAQGYNPRIYYQDNAELRETLEMINTGYFNRENPYLYNDIYNSLVYDDYYLLFADYFEYVKMQEKVDEIYLNKNVWTKMSILNTANMGKFSSDRTITQYANDIWKIKPVSIKKRLKKDVSS